MFSKGLLAALAALTLIATVSADGLYTKGSAVLQVDGKSYDKLIANSNQVSVGSQFNSQLVLILNENYRS